MAMMWRILVAALVLGILGCDREAAENPEKQRQEQAFVATVGRSPSPGKINDAGKTDLHIVAKLNLPMLAISLLQQGANVHVRDNRGFTPLHGAAQADASATAEVLLQQGANVHAKTNEGSTPLHSAALKDTLLLRPPRSCSSKGPTSTPKTTMALRRCTLRHGWMLLRPPRSCSSKGPTSTPKPTRALRRCTLRQRHGWMLLRPPRSCSSKGPTSTPKTTRAIRRCTLRH